MPWKPSEPGEVPTLGYEVIDWMSAFLAAPSRGDYAPFVPYREQEDFILRFYEINPLTGKRRRNRGLLGRPRGWGKSPLLAALAWCEALGPVVPDGWDADGQPVGVGWDELWTPLVHIAAVSEEQVSNTWRPLLEMAEGPVVDEYPGVEPMDTMVNLPRGMIEKRTASARTIKGAPAVFAVLDQTEEWVPGNGGPRLAARMRENAAKVGGSTVESPNAFIQGDKSVAEQSAVYADTIRNGTALDDGLLYDDREAPATTEYYDRESVTLGLRIVYGDSSDHPDGCLIHDPPCAPGHAPLDSIRSAMWATDYDPLDGRANFLNQKTQATNAWLSEPVWRARYAFGDDLTGTVEPVSDGDLVTLGFDGSRGMKVRGKPDATALVGVRVSDGHVFELDVWEAGPDQDSWVTWQPPLVAIEARIADAFSRYRVAAFYCDPAKDWRSYVNKWEAQYAAATVPGVGGKRVHVSRDHPFEWWMTGGRNALIQRAIEQLEGAVRNSDMTHDGSSSLTAHVINARRNYSGGRLTLRKENDYSEKKIDAAVAAVLAWQARLDAVAAGVRQVRGFVAPVRLR